MRIDGRALAQKILEKLKRQIKTSKIKPHLAIVLVGKNPVWEVYVRQKELKAKEIGAKTTRYQLPVSVTTPEILKLLNDLNHLSKIQGIIIQRPLPPQIDKKKLSLAINPLRDVDGFHPQSRFPMPVAEAVMRILEEISRYQPEAGDASRGAPRGGPRLVRRAGYAWGWRAAGPARTWLQSKKIVVIGKGETAGEPIILMLKKMGIEPQVVDSQTHNPELITKRADIIISCVGKPRTIRPELIKGGVILISVGLYKEADDKFHGDYEEEKIADIASFYTPVPGGVGPVNVACLLENLVKAATKTKN